MFKFDLQIPTYAEWKAQLDKLIKEQPEQAKKYHEQVLERKKNQGLLIYLSLLKI